MNRDINLAGTIKKRRLPAARVALFRKIAAIIGVATAIFGILVFFITIQFSLGLAKADQEKVNTKLFSYQKKIAQARLLKDSLTQIRNVTIKREEKFSKLEEIISKKPEGVETDTIDLGEKSLILSFKSTSLEPMNKFIESLKGIKNSAAFKEIRISELKTSVDGYTLSLSIN